MRRASHHTMAGSAGEKAKRRKNREVNKMTERANDVEKGGRARKMSETIERTVYISYTNKKPEWSILTWNGKHCERFIAKRIQRVMRRRRKQRQKLLCATE